MFELCVCFELSMVKLILKIANGDLVSIKCVTELYIINECTFLWAKLEDCFAIAYTAYSFHNSLPS